MSAIHQVLLLLTVIALLSAPAVAQRGRGRGRSRAKTRILGLPITGKYRDPESDQYYNNQNGAKIIMASHFDYEYILGHKIAFLCVAKVREKPARVVE